MVLISQAFCGVLEIRKVILYLLNILSTPVKSFVFRSVNSSEQIRETVRTCPNAHSPQPLPPSPSGRVPVPTGPGKSASPRRRAEVHMTRRWQLPPYPQTLCPGRAMGFRHIPPAPPPAPPLGPSPKVYRPTPAAGSIYLQQSLLQTQHTDSDRVTRRPQSQEAGRGVVGDQGELGKSQQVQTKRQRRGQGHCGQSRV